MSRGLSTESDKPVISTTLKQMVMSFQLMGHGVNDLMSGCQPFLVSYAGSAHHYSAVAAADVGNQLSQGGQNASLSDYRTIREKERLKFPRDISEVCITLTRFAVLCQCLLQGTGPLHPFVEAMWTTIAGFQNGAPFITERFHALSWYQCLYHARIIRRAIRVSVHDYMQMVASNTANGITGVEIPSVTTTLQKLRRGPLQNSTNWVDIPRPAPAIAATTTPPPRQHTCGWWCVHNRDSGYLKHTSVDAHSGQSHSGDPHLQSSG